MVSDASSGPQQNLGEEDYGLCYHAPVDAALLLPAKISNVKRQKKKESRLGKLNEKASALDDTASSPIFTCTNNNYSINIHQSSAENVITDFSQGYSTTQFHGQPAHQEHTDLFQCSLLPANQLQPNQWFEERRWGY
ncbi:unnamed protein product [Cuscuta campestris]|nr:unnamed protein product [Cuscuta campestris]